MSLSTLFETQVKIGISDADFKKGIATAGAMVKDFASSGVKALGSLTGSFASLTKDVASSVKELAVYGDHIDKQSQKMNMSAKAYQEWDAVLKHSGTSIDTMQASIKTLSTAVESGDDAFEALGMSLEEVQQLSGEDLFARTITALQNVEDDTKRTYLAGQLLGRGATELGALLNTSAEDTELMRQRVHELGGVMSDTAIKDSARFQDSLQDLQTSIGGLKKSLTTDFLPSFADVADGLTMIFAGEQGGESKLEQGMNNVITSISDSARKIKPVITRLSGSIFKTVKESLPQLMTRLGSLTGDLINGVISNIPNVAQYTTNLLSVIGDSIVSNLPMLAETAGTAISQFAGYISNNLPQLIPQGAQAVTELIKGMTSPEISRTLIGAAFDVVDGFIDGLTAPETLNSIISAAPVIVDNVVTGVVNVADRLGDAALSLCTGLVNWFGVEENRRLLLDCGANILATVADGFISCIGTSANALYNFGGVIAENIGLGEYWETGNKALTEWWGGFKEKFPDFKEWFNNAIKGVLSFDSSAEKIADAAAEVLTTGTHQHEGSHGGSGGTSDRGQVIGPKEFDYSVLDTIEPYKESVLPSEYLRKHGSLEDRKRTTYHAAGAIIDEPLTTHVFGEAGREAVLPLDNNTSWMDKLVDKISSRNTTVNIYHTGSLNDEADFERFVERLDNALANRYIGQDRAIGVTLA